jgi:hypothetical protein
MPATASLLWKRASSAFATLFRSVGDLVLQMAGLMIAAELTQRRIIELKENVTQLLGWRITGGKTLSVNLAQRADQGVAVLVADFAVMVTVAIVETCLTHGALHCDGNESILPSGQNGNLAMQHSGSLRGPIVGSESLTPRGMQGTS